MIYRIADNITSPLGKTTADNFRAILEGRSALRLHEGTFGQPEPFYASLFEEGDLPEIEGYTRFERAVIHSVGEALSHCGADITDPRTLFILSTTKGNIELLQQGDEESVLLGRTARKIADYFHHPGNPLVVSNACISGVCAQIAAMRAIRSGRYDTAVVTGCEVQSRFIVSGFQAFHALSPDLCRPYDKDRQGLNLGEAAATLVLSRFAPEETGETGVFVLEAGSNHNDANHISGPSRTGEGSYQVLRDLSEGVDKDDIAFINAHGTSTLYNDEMESIAIHRASLDALPVNSLKGYYGHTMGAAGILEVILSLQAVSHHVVLGTRGYAACGTTYPLQVSSRHGETSRPSFIKLMSGFGGCNAGVRWREQRGAKRGERNDSNAEDNLAPRSTFHVPRPTFHAPRSTFHALYSRIAPYPKFHKMDALCKAGFAGSEMLLQQLKDRERETAIILFNSTSSLCDDLHYQATIQDKDNFFPSPAVFVYTLANIVTGEIAIRNGWHGETAFYVLEKFDEERINAIAADAFQDPHTRRILTGWTDCRSDDDYDVRLWLLEREEDITQEQ